MTSHTALLWWDKELVGVSVEAKHDSSDGLSDWVIVLVGASVEENMT